MQMIRDASGFIGNWVRQELDEPPVEGSMAFGFVNDDGKLICGILIHDVKQEMCALSIASKSPRWCTKENIAAIADVLSENLGKRYVYTMTPAMNHRARKLVEGLGFKQDGVMRQAAKGGEDDLIIYGVLREDCPFIDK
jgi:RimJ/RimL family protein N-acetyltransferase